MEILAEMLERFAKQEGDGNALLGNRTGRRLLIALDDAVASVTDGHSNKLGELRIQAQHGGKNPSRVRLDHYGDDVEKDPANSDRAITELKQAHPRAATKYKVNVNIKIPFTGSAGSDIRVAVTFSAKQRTYADKIYRIDGRVVEWYTRKVHEKNPKSTVLNIGGPLCKKCGEYHRLLKFAMADYKLAKLDEELFDRLSDSKFDCAKNESKK